MKLRRLAVAGFVILTAPPVFADVVLAGRQHIGDIQSATFSVPDPVTRNEFASNPTRFQLTQALQITGLRLENFVSASPAPLAGQQIRITFGGQPTRTVLQNGGVLTFSPITLNPGFRTIAIDPGCLRSGVQSFNCRASDNEFDIGFSAITLLAAGTSLSINLAQRRHIGDTFDYRGNNNFSDAFYPDEFEAASVDLDFDLPPPQGLRLYQIDFSRLRDGARAGQFLSRGRAAVFTRTFLTQVCDFGLIDFERNVNLLSLQQGNCFLPAGGYFLRVTAGQMKAGTSESDTGLDDISWKDIILLLAQDVSGVPGRFNAIASDQLDVATGVIRTQIAGAPLGRSSGDPVGIDAVALDNGLLFSSYSGTANVELLDASDDTGTLDASGCSSRWLSNRVYLGQLSFAFAGGRKTLPGTWEVANAYSKARLLLTDTLSPQSYGCSTDAFAVRPNTFALAATDQDWENADPAGTGRSLNNLDAAVVTPLHKAGRPFTIRATALNADGGVTTGYVGTPTVTAAGTILGANVGDVSGGVWAASGGVAQTDTARYNEAGAVRLEVRDTTFAAVDAADTDSTNRQISPANIAVGRFVPDHFNVTYNAPEFEPGCGSFSYSGQRFQFRAGFSPSATLTAVAFGAPPTTTRNYTGALYKLPTPPNNFLPGISGYTALGGHGLDPSMLPNPDNTLADTGDGLVVLNLFSGSNFGFLRPVVPTAPFDAEIEITRVVTDSEGVTTEPSPLQFGQTAAGLGVSFTGGQASKQIRFGRLVLDNAHGSELLPLGVPLRTEYWAVTGGFQSANDDSCTSLPRANIGLSGALGSSTSVAAMPDPIVLSGGKASVLLAAPTGGATGTLTVTADLSLALLPWLWADGDNDNDFNENDITADPSARADFGLFKSDTRRIYQREVVR